MDPSPSLSAGTRNWKKSPQQCPPTRLAAAGPRAQPRVPAQPSPARPPQYPSSQDRTNLVQHHVRDLGQPLGFLHAGKDELEAQQELAVVAFLFLGVQRFPLLCGREEKGKS